MSTEEVDKQQRCSRDKQQRSAFGLQWTVTYDILQVWRGTNKEVEALITHWKILTLVSLVIDHIRLFAPFSVHMRRLLKGIWNKNGRHWFLRWKYQHPIVAETSFNRRYFNTERDKLNFMSLLSHLNTRYVHWSIYVHNRRNTQLIQHLSLENADWPQWDIFQYPDWNCNQEQMVKKREIKIYSCSL